MRDLEAIVAHDCVLASNTSSLSITAVARGLEVPGRVVGMHFFNPVPLMRLVEVVSGLATEPAVADAIHMLAQRLGQDRGAREVHAGLHRQPHRAAVLRRDAGAAAGTGGHAGGARRLRARRRLSHGPVRADGPDRPRHQLLRHAIGLRGQLLRQALPALAGAARDGRRRPARTQVGPRLLPLSRGRREDQRRRRPRPRRCPPCRWCCTAAAPVADLLAARLAASGLGFAREAAGRGRRDQPADRRRPPDAHRRPLRRRARGGRGHRRPRAVRLAGGPGRGRGRRRPSWRWPGRAAPQASAEFATQRRRGAARARLAAATPGRRAGPGGRAHDRDAGQRGQRRGGAGRVRRRRRRCGDDAGRELSGRPVRLARAVGRRRRRCACSTRSTRTTAASATASARDCAGRPGACDASPASTAPPAAR